jgi:predicted acylesterase/phospholipase RssA
MELSREQRRVAIVVGSGGVKSAAVLGLWQALRREGIQVSMAVGSSGGSICAAMIALGHGAIELKALTRDLWTPNLMSGYTCSLRSVHSGESRFTEWSGLADGQELTNPGRGQFSPGPRSVAPTVWWANHQDTATGQASSQARQYRMAWICGRPLCATRLPARASSIPICTRHSVTS